MIIGTCCISTKMHVHYLNMRSSSQELCNNITIIALYTLYMMMYLLFTYYTVYLCLNSKPHYQYDRRHYCHDTIHYRDVTIATSLLPLSTSLPLHVSTFVLNLLRLSLLFRLE